jgi:hypothetical protein
MTNLEIKLSMQNQRQYLIAEYSPIILAAGYSGADMDVLPAEDCFFLAGSIMSRLRTEVCKRATANTKPVVGDEEYFEVLNEMSDVQKTALRDSIHFVQPQYLAKH